MGSRVEPNIVRPPGEAQRRRSEGFFFSVRWICRQCYGCRVCRCRHPRLHYHNRVGNRRRKLSNTIRYQLAPSNQPGIFSRRADLALLSLSPPAESLPQTPRRFWHGDIHRGWMKREKMKRRRLKSTIHVFPLKYSSETDYCDKNSMRRVVSCRPLSLSLPTLDYRVTLVTVTNTDTNHHDQQAHSDRINDPHRSLFSTCTCLKGMQ